MRGVNARLSSDTSEQSNLSEMGLILSCGLNPPYRFHPFDLLSGHVYNLQVNTSFTLEDSSRSNRRQLPLTSSLVVSLFSSMVAVSDFYYTTGS